MGDLHDMIVTTSIDLFSSSPSVSLSVDWYHDHPQATAHDNSQSLSLGPLCVSFGTLCICIYVYKDCGTAVAMQAIWYLIPGFGGALDLQNARAAWCWCSGTYWGIFEGRIYRLISNRLQFPSWFKRITQNNPCFIFLRTHVTGYSAHVMICAMALLPLLHHMQDLLLQQVFLWWTSLQ